MNNLPENEKIEQVEEKSTIFSDPKEHREVKKKGKNKILVTVVSVLSVALIIGASFAIIKFIPERIEENQNNVGKIELCDYGAGYNSITESENVKSVKLTNKNGTFNLYSEAVGFTDSTTGEDTYELKWYLKGYDKELTDTSLLEDVVRAVVDIDAIRLIDTKTEAQCGLDKPSVEATVTLADKSKFTVEIGDKSPDNAGVYLKISTKEGIYLVGGNLDDTLTFTDIEMANTEAHPAITLDEKYSDYVSGSSIQKFDDITISGKNFEKDLVFELNPEENLASYSPYVMVEPIRRSAENLDGIYTMFSQGFAVTGAYSYDVKASTIKKFGLDSPDFVVSMRFDDFVYSYKFALQRDGDYAVVGTDSKNVRRVSASGFDFLSYGTTDFYNQVVFITPIDGVSNLTLKTSDKTYDFSIVKNPNGSEEVNTYIVECDGKTYNSTYFQSFYQFLCLLECMEFDVEKTNAKPALTITYTYNDKDRAPTVIEFVKINSTKYQCSLDGVKLGKIGASTYNKIFKNLERLLDGKQVLVN